MNHLSQESMSKNRVTDSFLPFYPFLSIIETIIDRLTRDGERSFKTRFIMFADCFVAKVAREDLIV